MKILFSLLLGISSLYMMAQPELLDTIVLSASHFNTSLMSANRNVQVISGKEIESAPVASIAELLDFVIGVDSRQRGIYGTQTDLSIRGGTFEQVLILINGVRLSDPQTGHHLMNLPVQKSDIERIEVLLGGGSYIFGESAFSGAINIITKDAERDQVTTSASVGSFNSYQLAFKQHLKGEFSTTSFSINTTASDGFKRNTDFQTTNLYGQTSIKLKEKQINLSGGYNWQGFGAQNFYSDEFPEQYEKTRTLFLNAGLKSGDKIEINRQLYWRRNWDEFQLYREGDGFYQYENGLFIKNDDTAASFYTSHNYHRSDVIGGKLEVRFNSVFGKTSLASEYRNESVISNNLGEPLEATIDINGSRGSYNLGSSRNNLSLSIEQQKRFGRFNFSPALLINYNSSFNFGLYPAMTAGYKIDSGKRLYASVNRSFRLPTFTDLYYKLRGAVGSKYLKPEHSLNYELGYKHYSRNSFFNVSFFRREGRDIIDWIKLCDSCELRASNNSMVNFNGMEINWRITGSSLLDRLHLKSLQVGYNLLFTDEDKPDYESLYVYDYLNHKATLRASHDLIQSLLLSYSISYQKRNGSYVNASNGATMSYDDVVLVNLRLQYSLKRIELYISAQNLLDKSYYDRGNMELPGLWIWVGTTATL